MDVYGTEPAEAHLAAIHGYLSETSPRYAERVVDRITDRTRQLAQFPRSGQIVPEAAELEIRELPEAPYRILYVVARDHIEILGVVHASHDVL